ncbi:right-handed parallel beta-helix repeat-containing protein [Geofilum rubicundum]|uniref:Pectate lyase L n=1 Tax=Geofilum rubicundum JCM 15548 TaxID=1236989 RepID=A0A0E9M095_9BACT|nr:T9SS type A sorting domain-containing protein [Geofilum rubicundum]GAO31257.1 pectate lyase L precursor [Geofilum rubicundum JCM 15548]
MVKSPFNISKKGKKTMKRNLVCSLCLSILACISLQAKQIFVSPNGYDTNDGTIESPFWSLQKAQSIVSAGDTVYIRGGDYVITERDISRVERDIFACVSFLNISGSKDQMIKYWAYPGEQPLFDFTAVKPANQRVVGFWVSGDYIHLKGIEITGVQVTILTHTESYCIYSWGNNNIFENISMHDNKSTGLRHRNGGYNLFLNCDAYNNHDDVSENQKGGNTDGFGCHPKTGGKGNVFRGCRAWFNSDDGFDCIRSSEDIIFDSCCSFYNGYSPSFESLGDGNGFKIGGYAYDEASLIPQPVPSNTVRFCVAVHNRANGFYSNHHLNGNIWLNNSAYKNAYNYNMVNRESVQSQNINVDGYNHVLKNNLGYNGRSGETAYLDASKNILVTNSFEMDLVLTDDDFINLDESALMAPRKADGSLPDIDFMKIAPSSPLIDAGTDIGFPFLGVAPEIGAFENALSNGLGVQKLEQARGKVYPNPVNNIIFVNGMAIQQAWITDISGRQQPIRIYENSIDVSQLGNGVYVLKVIPNQNKSVVEKIIISK